MHDIVGSIGHGQGIAEIDEHGGAPGRTARFDVALAITHHEALCKVNAEFHRRLEDHTRLWLATVADLAMPVEARLDGIEGQLTRHDLVHRVHFRVGDQAVSHVGLVGDYRQEKTRLLQLLEAGRGVGIQPEILQPSRGEAAPVTEFRNNDDPIPIEKHGRSQSVGTAYHFVCLRCKAGWLTRQCQTTAWKSSDKGVTQFGLTCGIRTTTSPCLAVYPLSRPTIPNTFAERALARSIAWMMLALILRSASPPPTE